MRALWIALLVAGCYEAPRPACGFWCGEGATCPTGYTCDVATTRCFAGGVDPATNGQPCEGERPPPSNTDRPTVYYAGPSCFDGVDYSCIEVAFSKLVYGVTENSLYLTRDGVLDFASLEVFHDEDSTYARLYTRLDLETDYHLYATDAIRDQGRRTLVPYDAAFRLARPDPTPPFITQRSPANGATDVSVRPELSVHFNRPVLLDASNFYVQVGATSYSGEIINTGNQSFRLRTSRQLPASTALLAVVQGPFTDFDGVPFVGDGSGSEAWSFTTGLDQVPPQVTMMTPSIGATDVAVSTAIHVYFDEDILPATPLTLQLLERSTSQPVSCNRSSSASSVLLVPDAPLAPSTTYDVFIEGISDSAGNQAFDSLSFTTAP